MTAPSEDHRIAGGRLAGGRLATERARAEAAEKDRDEARGALKPFATFAADNIDAEGWDGIKHRASISTWFGPSDFRAAHLALTTSPDTGGDHAGS